MEMAEIESKFRSTTISSFPSRDPIPPRRYLGLSLPNL
jgi:hypothetical protein